MKEHGTCNGSYSVRCTVINNYYLLTLGAGFMKPCALLNLDFLTSAYNKCIALVRKSRFGKVQWLHETGPRCRSGSLLDNLCHN